MSTKVLIAEDNDLNMQLFTDVVTLQGWTPLQAFNGPDALRMAAELQPDLIVMDIQLPEINGFDVIRRLRGEPDTQSIPIIVVTAFAMKGDEERILKSGCDMVLTKPVSMRLFTETISGFLAQTGKKG